jgi:iron only hydrogenase large subunit-like protein
VGACRAVGFDYVLDTNFSADLTIMEEAGELQKRIQEKVDIPQFTSCCPAWVKYVEIYYPSLLPYLSTAKSPVSMPEAKKYLHTVYNDKSNLLLK